MYAQRLRFERLLCFQVELRVWGNDGCCSVGADGLVAA